MTTAHAPFDASIIDDAITYRLRELRRGPPKMPIRELARYFHKRQSWVTENLLPEDQISIRHPKIRDEDIDMFIKGKEGEGSTATARKSGFSVDTVDKYYKMAKITPRHVAEARRMMETLVRG